jgi:glycosyl transferase family 25
MRYYVINLERSVERWRTISESAAKYGIELTRIPAVDGRAIPQSQWHNFDLASFRSINGREALSGEYGCYMSHITALRQYLADGGQSAVILEDDAILNPELRDCVEGLETRFGDRAILVRLVVHRMTGFESLGTVAAGPSTNLNLGQCWFGPNGSAAAYWLTRAAAENVLKTALPGSMPFDVFLERPWEHGTPSLMFYPPVLPRPNPPFSELLKTYTEGDLHKYPWYQRGGALLFRTVQLLMRLYHCARQRRLPR